MSTPKLSIIVTVHNMARQAMNTLHSLSCQNIEGLPAYQKEVSQQDYEVIVVENSSSNQLNPHDIQKLGNNFHYFLRQEKGVSPVPAVNFAYSKCRAKHICLIIDGARLVTPRMIHYALMACRMNNKAVVMVPGYHLGTQDQKQHATNQHSEALEIEKLDELNWKQNGYHLFEFACWSSSNQRGYFQPMQECSALICHRESFEKVGQAPEQFDQAGGGSVNLYLYRSIAMLPESVLFVLPGEGSFHQFHGGVTTSEIENREETLKEFDTRLEEVYGAPFKALTREPIMLGAVTHWAQPFLQSASEFASKRFNRLANNGKNFWEDDANMNRYTEHAFSGEKLDQKTTK